VSAEFFANQAQSSLTSGITAGATTLTVASAASFPAQGNFRIVVGSEVMLVTYVSNNVFTVTRAAEAYGGVQSAAAHNAGDTVTHVGTAAVAGMIAQVFNILAYGAIPNCQQITNGAMTSGSSTLTSASNPFLSTDVGKKILVPGGGSGSSLLSTTINTFNNAGSVVLAASNASGGNISSVLVTWGTDNTSAIQSAITAAQAVGGVVHIPTGAFLHLTQLTVSADNVSIIGNGQPGRGSGGKPAPLTGSILMFGSVNSDQFIVGKSPTVSTTNLTHGTISAGSTTFTDSGASFLTTDVGKVIALTGAGPGGGTLLTSINARTSGTQITLTNAALTALGGGGASTYGFSVQTTGFHIKNVALRSAVNRTEGAAIHTIYLCDSSFESLNIDYYGGGNQNYGIVLDGGGFNNTIIDGFFLGADPNGFSQGGGTVSGTPSGHGVAVWGLASSYGASTNLYAASDLFLDGGTTIAYWNYGLSIEGNLGGLTVSNTDLLQNQRGFNCTVAHGSTINREFYLGPACWIDSSYALGMEVDDHSLTVLSIAGAWFSANGTYQGSAIQSFPAGSGCNVGTNATELTMSVAGGYFEGNGGSGLQFSGGRLNCAGAFFLNNGGGTIGGAGLYLGGGLSASVTGCTFLNNQTGNGSSSSTGWAIRTENSITYYTIVGNTVTPNSNRGGISDTATSTGKTVTSNT
jgi:hypothetical protein